MTRAQPYRGLIAAWAVLMLLLAATITGAYVPIGPGQLPLALGIALAKATIVAVVFMRPRHATPLGWLAGGAGLLWLAILLGLAAVDYGTRQAAGF